MFAYICIKISRRIKKKLREVVHYGLGVNGAAEGNNGVGNNAPHWISPYILLISESWECITYQNYF